MSGTLRSHVRNLKWTASSYRRSLSRAQGIERALTSWTPLLSLNRLSSPSNTTMPPMSVQRVPSWTSRRCRWGTGGGWRRDVGSMSNARMSTPQCASVAISLALLSLPAPQDHLWVASWSKIRMFTLILFYGTCFSITGSKFCTLCGVKDWSLCLHTLSHCYCYTSLRSKVITIDIFHHWSARGVSFDWILYQ